ncbi:MAG: histidine--tRNA ligase [Bacteroidales bacterium]|nr:histidine--tRNA ligase [Bacteroidales bacterium]
MNQQLTIPKGTRDFNPEQVLKREFIFQTLKNVFTKYGFVPIETPVMEMLSTLLGKYGDEGDKLLFKILNSGDFTQNISNDEWNEKNLQKLSMKLCEKGLRYDLTVPFARYVVMHRNEIVFPFKRYQIQPVWRADRPQKGRYREFYQCDVDIIGTDSLNGEVELLHIIQDVFQSLNLGYITFINNRKILQGLAEQCEIENHFVKFTTIIDKLDKIGKDEVYAELLQLPIQAKHLENLKVFLNQFLELTTNDDRILLAKSYIQSNTGKIGINEIETILQKSNQIGLNSIKFDILLARGLNYYTGTILEVKSTEVEIGSICGGGRYDNLTGIFGLPNVSGVGMSFGADRIYDIMDTLHRFPENLTHPIHVFVANFIPEIEYKVLHIASLLRTNQINVDFFYDPHIKLKKQLSIANQKNILWVLIIGEEEIQKEQYLLKNMKTGEQYLLSLQEVIEKIKLS